MFINVGEKIKTVTKILLIVTVIISVILGIALTVFGLVKLIPELSSEAKNNDNIIIGASCTGGGIAALILYPLAACITSLFAYGYGELVTNSTTSALAAIKTRSPYKIGTLDPMVYPDRKPEPEAEATPELAEEPEAPKPRKTAKPADTVLNPGWYCPECGARNPQGPIRCQKCGRR